MDADPTFSDGSDPDMVRLKPDPKLKFNPEVTFSTCFLLCLLNLLTRELDLDIPDLLLDTVQLPLRLALLFSSSLHTKAVNA